MKHAETPIVLSHVQVKPLLEARRRGQSRAMTSLDLGLTTCEVTLQPDRVVFSETQGLAWDSLEEVARKEIACFLVEENAAKKIQSFSEELNRQYSLMPTEAAPTLLVSGLPMHRIKGTEPYQDALAKIRAIGGLAGRAQDTATGALLALDVWTDDFAVVSGVARRADCPCCVEGRYEFLDGRSTSRSERLCGRSAYQISPAAPVRIRCSAAV